jgi:hypothetical protein
LVVRGSKECFFFPKEESANSGTTLQKVLWMVYPHFPDYIAATEDGRCFTLISPGHPAEGHEYLPGNDSGAEFFAVVQRLEFGFDTSNTCRLHFQEILPDGHIFFKGLEHTSFDTSRYYLENMCQELHAKFEQEREVSGENRDMRSGTLGSTVISATTQSRSPDTPSLGSDTNIDAICGDCSSIQTAAEVVLERNAQETPSITEIVEGQNVTIEVSAHGEVPEMRIIVKKLVSGSRPEGNLGDAFEEPFAIEWPWENGRDALEDNLRDVQEVWGWCIEEGKREETLGELLDLCEDRRLLLKDTHEDSSSQ